MKTYNKIVSAIALGSLALASCTDLDTFPQSGTFTDEQKQDVVGMFPERLAADVSGMYASNLKQFTVFGAASQRGDDFGYPAVCLSFDLNGPDMVAPNNGYNWFSTCSEYSDRDDTYANNYMRWALFYNQIKLANDIIASIPEDTEDATLKSYRGQAKAVRAFGYLNLAPYYQFKYKGNEDKPCVPLVLEGMSDANNPRATVAQVYEQIMADLNNAIADLEGYVRNSAAEVDQQVAYGLRARANLYMENWQDAADDAAKAMAGSTPYQRSELTKPMFVDSQESGNGWIWSMEITVDDYPTNGSAMISWPGVLGSFVQGTYATGTGMYKSINVLLYDEIPATDVRKGWWLDANLHSDNLAGLTWAGTTTTGDAIATLKIGNQQKEAFLPYTNVKFGAPTIGGVDGSNDWPLMRAEEMILIQAEATAMAGGDGKSILENFVKGYRDPNYTCPAASGTAFQNEVWKQRRIELWGEGFSMADIMRLGKNVVRVKTGVTSNFPDAFQFNIAANDPWLLMRIPQDETNSNPGIPTSANNSGGNLPAQGDGVGLTDGVTD